MSGLMSAAHKEIINVKLMPLLIQQLQLDPMFLAVMRYDHCITETIMEQVVITLRNYGRQTAVAEFLTGLITRPEKAFKQLVKALIETHQDHLANAIDKQLEMIGEEPLSPGIKNPPPVENAAPADNADAVSEINIMVSYIGEKISVQNQAPSCIGEKENNKMLKVTFPLRNAPGFSLTIPSIVVNNDRLTVTYMGGQHDFNEPDQHPEEGQRIGQKVIDKRGLENLEKKLPEKYLKPQIRSTEKNFGLSSKLISIDNMNVRHRIGFTTALLTGATTTRHYALAVGHLTNVGDAIHFEQGNDLGAEIGVVVAKIVGNEVIDGDYMYIDAALIRLHKNAIEELELTQHFLIDNTPHALTVAPQSPQIGRVVLRAIDQTSNDIKGIVVSNNLVIFGDPGGPMYGLTQIGRFNEEGNHDGLIHGTEEMGLLVTYEPTLELPERVQPAVMLIGFCPGFNENGELASCYSIGIDLKIIVKRFVQFIGEQLQIRTSLLAPE